MKTQSRATRTPQQINAAQSADAEAAAAKRNAQTAQSQLPTVATPPQMPALPDTRTAHQRYLDEVDPSTIAGKLIKFDGKAGVFKVAEDDTEVDDAREFIALCDETMVGWIKFNGEGEPPTKIMGLLYDGFTMPGRETLGDNNSAEWELGLSGTPQDPWQHQQMLVLQDADTSELFTFATSSVTGRRAVGKLLRAFDRMRASYPDDLPVIRLLVGGFEHRDDRIGWVNTPSLNVVRRIKRNNAASSSMLAKVPARDNMNDEIPF